LVPEEYDDKNLRELSKPDFWGKMIEWEDDEKGREKRKIGLQKKIRRETLVAKDSYVIPNR
jgi:hypothetical protein